MNLVDVRDVAVGLLLAMQRGKSGHRYILGGENISLKKLLAIVAAISGRKALRIPVSAGFAQMTTATIEFIAPCDPSATGRDTRGRADRTAVQTAVDRKIAAGTRLRAASTRVGIGGGHFICSWPIPAKVSIGWREPHRNDAPGP